jgi:hypothetical protein
MMTNCPWPWLPSFPGKWLYNTIFNRLYDNVYAKIKSALSKKRGDKREKAIKSGYKIFLLE